MEQLYQPRASDGAPAWPWGGATPFSLGVSPPCVPTSSMDPERPPGPQHLLLHSPAGVLLVKRLAATVRALCTCCWPGRV